MYVQYVCVRVTYCGNLLPVSILISLNNIEILESFKGVLKEHYFINYLLCMYVCISARMNRLDGGSGQMFGQSLKWGLDGMRSWVRISLNTYIHTYMQLHFHTHFEFVTMCGCERFWGSIITE